MVRSSLVTILLKTMIMLIPLSVFSRVHFVISYWVRVVFDFMII